MPHLSLLIPPCYTLIAMAGNREAFEQAMNRGHSAAWELQWDKALACYRAALTEFPNEPNALTSLGFALLQSDKPEDALKVYQRAASLTPGDPMAPEKCGEIFEQLGRLNEAAQTYLAVAEIHLNRRDIPKAIDNWNRVVRLTPDNLNAHSRLALAYERTSKTPLAVLEYIEVARIFQRMGHSEKGMQAANRALQLMPQSPEAHDALEKLRKGVPLPVLAQVTASHAPRPGSTGMLSPGALAALDQKAARTGTSRLDKASARLERVASPLDASREVALAQLAEMLFDEDTDTSKTAGSVAAITKGATGLLGKGKPNRAQAIMFLGQALNNTSNNEIEAAIGNFESVLDAGLESPLVGFMLGALALEANRPKEAIKHLQPVVAREDVGFGAAYGLGEAHRREGNLREAFTSLLEALKRLDMQLVSPARQDALAEAYETVNESLARASDAEVARTVPGLVQFLSGDGWEERARQTRQQLDAAAEDGQVSTLTDMLAAAGGGKVLDSMRRIEQYMKQGLWATAMEEAFYAIEFSPTYLPVHTRMAEILTAENKPAAASAKYAIVAESYRQRGERGRAARIMQQVLRLNPLDLNVRSQLIDMYLDQGKLEDALSQYIELADAHATLADLARGRATYSDALKVAQENRLDPAWSVRILHKLGDIDMQLLNWREALKEYEQIKTLAVGDEKARLTLIDLHFRLGNPKGAVSELDAFLKQLLAARNVHRAASVLEELSTNYPEDLTLLTRLARMYQDMGRKMEAIAQYEKLGELQLNAGQNVQAAETIKAIIALGPDDPAPYQELLAQISA